MYYVSLEFSIDCLSHLPFRAQTERVIAERKMYFLCACVCVACENWVSWYQKGRTILDFNKASDDGVAVASAGPWVDTSAGRDENGQMNIQR